MTWQQPPPRSASPRVKTNAANLRRSQTEAERRLWWHLRHRLPVEGSHFRRQVPLGSYVADFCCLAARLIVEVDGDQHGFKADAAYDLRRTRALEAQGFRVLRFSNLDVTRSIDSVLDTIFATLSARPRTATNAPAADASGWTTPISISSPQGGGEPAQE
ncbi:endonuclease domain-containing protein [Methylobacterium sp. J-076]|uniref:endonuclease domain-containing protein n=1 Tax=Methylobacterium sp. J-076 TaxID=2836655 RepID=UPI001FB9F620|nr:DUF559 domain-containing protein [Methylobacterium sp. J-076]MCJ2011849.1 DUF559 domain-containing protein [Methylobacterium sp. J-076]